MDTRFWSLVGVSALFTLGLGGIARQFAPNRAAEAIDSARRLTWRERFDIVFVGDSRTHDGIAPSAMAESFPGKSIGNFAWGALAWSPQVIEAAEKTLKPDGLKVMVLGVSPHGFNTRGAMQNAFTDASQSNWADRWFLRSYPSAANYFAPWGPSWWFRRLNPELGQVPFELHDDGWYEAKPPKIQGARVLKAHADRLKASPFERERLDALCKEIEGLVRRGVRVYAFCPPASEQMRTIERELGGYDEPLVRDALERAGATYLTVDGTYEPYDGSHLPSAEAIRFSKAIAEKLAR